MEVSVRVTTQLQRILRGQAPPSDESQGILALIGKSGLTLQPVSPDGADPYLGRDFTIETPDPATAEKVASGLLRFTSVEGAYFKHSGEPP